MHVYPSKVAQKFFRISGPPPSYWPSMLGQDLGPVRSCSSQRDTGLAHCTVGYLKRRAAATTITMWKSVLEVSGSVSRRFPQTTHCCRSRYGEADIRGASLGGRRVRPDNTQPHNLLRGFRSSCKQEAEHGDLKRETQRESEQGRTSAHRISSSARKHGRMNPFRARPR